MLCYLNIRTSKFPILEGEEDEITNPGTYGKAFAEYLKKNLGKRGYDVPFICCEDWGWWVEVKLPLKIIGLICGRAHDENTECNFFCSPSPDKNRVWSWSKFRMVDIGHDLSRLISDLKQIFTDDPEIEFLGETDE